MNLQQFYAMTGGNYDDALGRLRKDERIMKYLVRIPEEEAADYNGIFESAAAENWDALFSFSHTLKGVAANLSLTDLFGKASAICEAVRDGSAPGKGKAPETDLGPMLDELKKTWDFFVLTLEDLDRN